MSDLHLERMEASNESPLAQAIKQAIESLATLQASVDQGFADMKEHIDRGSASRLRNISSESTRPRA